MVGAKLNAGIGGKRTKSKAGKSSKGHVKGGEDDSQPKYENIKDKDFKTLTKIHPVWEKSRVGEGDVTTKGVGIHGTCKVQVRNGREISVTFYSGMVRNTL